VALELGIDPQKIKKGLKEYKPLEHRLSLLKIKNTFIIDDTYNNNPAAAKEAIKLFSELGDKKNMAIVLGICWSWEICQKNTIKKLEKY
ncbi:hypothetical protein KKC36_01360, partial [Patescibacteria group bacterium]|nr:hypothetical protein [Patescibacteria group bacterium]